MRSLLIFLLAFCTIAYSQSNDEIITQILEDMANSTDDDDDGLTEDALEQATEILANLVENPLNLNTANHEDMEQLLFLSPIQIENLIRYRNNVKQIQTPYELLLINDFSRKDIENLLSVSYLGKIEEKEITRYWKQEILARVARTFPKAKGYISNDSTVAKYLGAPYKELFRVRGQIDETFLYGLIAENDAGEPMFSHGTTLTDFTSGFIQYKKKNSMVRKIILGHYQAQLGQGLGMWTGFTADGSSVGNSIDRRAKGISPTTSASEYDFLRGVAIELKKNPFTLDLFASLTDGDATLYYDQDSSIYITGISTSSYHRTESERNKRHNLQKQLYGGAFVYSHHKLKTSLGFNYSHYNYPFGQSNNLYQYFIPTGKHFSSLHADYHYYLPKMLLYGEIVYQDAKTIASMQALDLSLGNGNSLTVAYRYFGKKYYPFNQNPFAINSKPGGENGLYASLALSPFRNFTFRTNINVYQNNWLTSSAKYSTSTGLKCRVNATYVINNDNSLFFRFRFDNREKYSGKIPYSYKKTNFSLQYLTTPTNFLRFQTTIEGIHYVDPNTISNGFLVSQDAKLILQHINIIACIAHFDTDDYNSRIYSSQSDVLYSYSVPSFYGQGINALLNFRWKIRRNISLWLWGNYTKYFDRDEISSGNNLLASSQRFDAKIQLQIKLDKQLLNR